MFDVGFAEIFLLSLIGLLVLGPERLPGVARTIGGFVRKARTSWISLRNTIEAEMAEADISEPIKQAREEFKQIGDELKDIPGFTGEDIISGKTKSGPVKDTEAANPQKSESETVE
jgi:sec-independent protein translocase protein TatB